jgi:predicted transcriptional regulator
MMTHRNTEADQGPCTLMKIVIVEGLLRKDQGVKVCETAEVTGIAKSTVHEIITDLTSIKCLLRWVMKMPTN